MATTPLAQETFSIHRVPVTRPLVWLVEGWNDLLHHRGASLAYGVIVALLGALILAYQQNPIYVAAVTAAFLLVGPILTAGLCELSRCRDQGEEASFQNSLLVLQRRRSRLLEFALSLLVITLVWLGVSGVFYYSLAGSIAPSLESTVWGDVMRQVSSSQLIAYIAIGVVLSAIVFVLSVVSVPMIIDREVSVRTAMAMSLRVVSRDFPAMLMWALLIAGLVLIGFFTQLIGLLVIFPLLGHATWRAYRELVEH
jgi:uncharacterized membrane protein